MKNNSFIEKIKKLGLYILYAFIAIVVIYMVADDFFISNEEIEDLKYQRQLFQDGRYSTEVYYKNTCTGFDNYYYDISVDIESNHLKRINFPNGGFLDNSKLLIEEKLNNDEFIVKNKDGCSEYHIKIIYQEVN